jgi:hypothetical protein
VDSRPLLRRRTHHRGKGIGSGSDDKESAMISTIAPGPARRPLRRSLRPFRADRPRKIDAYIDYFGGGGGLRASRCADPVEMRLRMLALAVFSVRFAEALGRAAGC